MAKKANKDQRLKRLLEAGYFPAELPPPFVTTDFAKFRKKLFSDWPPSQLKAFKSEPELFSIPRFNRTRRRLSIVNPINQFKVSEIISGEWLAIKTFLAASKVSEFKPIFDLEGERAFFKIDFDKIERRLIEILSMYRSCLRTDISRYFPTIYTHSIAWALHTKNFCKNNLHTPAFKSTIGNRLDIALRQGQDGQTVGIPIGPDTSRVIGEVIGVALENALKSNLKNFEDRAFRYVDDIAIGFDDDESDESIISSVSKAFYEFELDINPEKTLVAGAGEIIDPDWVGTLRTFQISSRSRNQQGLLDQYFKMALSFADKNPRDNVLLFAIRRSRTFKINPEYWPFYTDYLLRICRKSSSCIPAVCQILIEAKHFGRPLKTLALKKFVIDAIRTHGLVHNYYEVAWCLFLAKGLKLKIKKENVSGLFEAESSICALILLDLNANGLIEGGIDTTFWQTFCTSAGLKTRMWLLAYEAILKGWLPKSTPCYVASDPLFGPMIKKKIKFYDTRKNVKFTRAELLQEKIASKKIKRIFSNIDAYF